jgi:hypothetical protein
MGGDENLTNFRIECNRGIFVRQPHAHGVLLTITLKGNLCPRQILLEPILY